MRIWIGKRVDGYSDLMGQPSRSKHLPAYVLRGVTKEDLKARVLEVMTACGEEILAPSALETP